MSNALNVEKTMIMISISFANFMLSYALASISTLDSFFTYLIDFTRTFSRSRVIISTTSIVKFSIEISNKASSSINAKISSIFKVIDHAQTFTIFFVRQSLRFLITLISSSTTFSQFEQKQTKSLIRRSKRLIAKFISTRSIQFVFISRSRRRVMSKDFEKLSKVLEKLSKNFEKQKLNAFITLVVKQKNEESRKRHSREWAINESRFTLHIIVEFDNHIKKVNWK